jgi:hypothetical protein
VLRKRIEAIPVNYSLLVAIMVVVVSAMFWINWPVVSVQKLPLLPEPQVTEAPPVGVAAPGAREASLQYRTAYDATLGEDDRLRNLHAATSQYRTAYDQTIQAGMRPSALSLATDQYRRAYDATFAVSSSTWRLWAGTLQYRAAYDSTFARDD